MKKFSLSLVLLLVFGQSAVFAASPKEARSSLLKSIEQTKMIIYRPAVTKAVVTVFTDMDCAYCEKLHAEIPQLMRLNIEVRYLAYPRRGLGSSSYNKWVSVWCSKDPKEAMSRAMRGEAIKPATCSNPIAHHMSMGKQARIIGTPTIIYADGAMNSGYLSAETLAREAIQHSERE